MSIDPKGTAPGLNKKTDEPKTVNAKCRNPKCDSITAIEIKVGAQAGVHSYRCTKCGHPWGINLGGYVGF